MYWGTYQLIEAACDAARKSLPLFALDGSTNDPSFEPWRGEGQVSVQIVGGISVADLESDTQVRLEPPVDLRPAPRTERIAAHRARNAAKATGRREHATLAIRVGSTESGRPVWARFAMVLQRSLPPDARIKRVTVSLRMRGPREEWSSEWTVETAQRSIGATRHGVRATVPGQHGAVAVDIGWRSMQGGIRVATWWGEDGGSGELRVSDDVVTGLRKLESLRSIADCAFDVVRAELVAWLGANEHPEWIARETVALAAWKSETRLMRLFERWRNQRFVGDDDAFLGLAWWRHHARHIWRWREDMRVALLRRRREEYRVLASSLARRYSTLVLERFDLRTMARNAPDDAPNENPNARWQRHAMGPSELRIVLCNAFRRGMGTLKRPHDDDVDARDSTRECHACGAVASFRAAESSDRPMPCPSCGTTAAPDQDDNAARVLLGRWRERSGGAPTSGTARNSDNGAEPNANRGSKWTRAAEKKSARIAEQANARKPTSNAAE